MKKQNICFLTIVVIVSLVAVSLFSGEATATDDVILSLGNMSVLPGKDIQIQINLINPYDAIMDSFVMDLKDEDNYLKCSGCLRTDRTPGGSCSTQEQANGDCKVTVIGNDKFEEGYGPILIVSFGSQAITPEGAVKTITINSPTQLHKWPSGSASVCRDSGKILFRSYEDVCPPESSPGADDCGNDMVDSDDVFCMQDLLTTTPDSCQTSRADVPTGNPNIACNSPDGVIDFNDFTEVSDKVVGSPHCLNYFEDTDGDGDYMGDACDNCPSTFNPGQEDTFPPQGNGIGDACDCEPDFDCDGDVEAFDIVTFLEDFGRGFYDRPCESENTCNGDFSCDSEVDAFDMVIFLEDFGRGKYDRPCPICDGSAWCSY